MSDYKRIVQYGEWKIEVDIEETKRYYKTQKAELADALDLGNATSVEKLNM